MTYATHSDEIAAIATANNLPRLSWLAVKVRGLEQSLDDLVDDSMAEAEEAETAARARSEAMRAGNVVCLARAGIAARMGR